MEKKLWCDLKTLEEKRDFIKSGRAVETGIIAKAIENDLFNIIDRLLKYEEAEDTEGTMY